MVPFLLIQRLGMMKDTSSFISAVMMGSVICFFARMSVHRMVLLSFGSLHNFTRTAT